MADLVFVSIIVAFFALAWLLVHACDSVIGADDPVAAAPTNAPVLEGERAA